MRLWNWLLRKLSLKKEEAAKEQADQGPLYESQTIHTPRTRTVLDQTLMMGQRVRAEMREARRKLQDHTPPA